MLTTEVHKILNDIYPPIMKIFFLVLEKNKYNLRNFKKMNQQKIKTIRFGLETALYCALQLSFPKYKVITSG